MKTGTILGRFGKEIRVNILAETDDGWLILEMPDGRPFANGQYLARVGLGDVVVDPDQPGRAWDIEIDGGNLAKMEEKA